MNELVFQVEPDEDSGYVARAKLSHGSIITQGDTLDELRDMIEDAVSGYFLISLLKCQKAYVFILTKCSP